jgi:hypothetical protein
MCDVLIRQFTRQIVRDGTSGGENRLVLQSFGEVELLDPLCDIFAATAARIADRLAASNAAL